MHNPNKFNSTIKMASIVIVVVFIFVLLGFVTTSLRSNQEVLDYSGTNALYIETKDSLIFHWITNENDEGIYQLSTTDNQTLAKGNTPNGRVHTFTANRKPNKGLKFQFGGKKEGSHEVVLRPVKEENKDTFKNVDSLFVVGDVHGKYYTLIHLLQQSKIIDKDLNWIAGKAHLAFLGDLFDRGNEVTKTLWFIYSLKDKALRAGGMVHLVLGNHEIMTMNNDLRYLSKKETIIAAVYKKKYGDMFHPSHSFLGNWITTKPSVLKIDQLLLTHGGVVDLGTNNISIFNKKAKTYIKDPLFLELMKDSIDSLKYDIHKWNEMRHFFYSAESPYWYRGYVLSDTLEPQLDKMLQRYKSKIHIVAHTPLESISEKYHGKLITTDLNKAATQLLLLVKKNKKYKKYMIDSQGKVVKL